MKFDVLLIKMIYRWGVINAIFEVMYGMQRIYNY